MGKEVTKTVQTQIQTAIAAVPHGFPLIGFEWRFGKCPTLHH